MIKTVFYFCLIILFSCVEKHFIAFSIDGERLNYEDLYSSSSGISDFKLFFNKDEIDLEYKVLHFIATDYYYYGQFFFDKNFMSMLKNKTLYMGADALIYDKNRTDFPNYNENFLYFTAIKYKK